MSKPRLFGAKDEGTHADGTFGHHHVRQVLAGLVQRCGDTELARALHQDPTPDMSEEREAINVLNNNTDDSCAWDFYDGSLCLVKLPVHPDEIGE